MSRKVPHDHLGPRETQIISLMCEGLNDKETAYRLGLSYATVKTSIHLILRRLGMANRVQLGIWWDRKIRRSYVTQVE